MWKPFRKQRSLTIVLVSSCVCFTQFKSQLIKRLMTTLAVCWCLVYESWGVRTVPRAEGDRRGAVMSQRSGQRYVKHSGDGWLSFSLSLCFFFLVAFHVTQRLIWVWEQCWPLCYEQTEECVNRYPLCCMFD